ncbi:anti-sigma factor [Nocardiopsis lucentensis]|uniref:hypothetical protein n=1 Tax=Nocardiopsis lucentensis TaxID=53441 RepID=UPI00034BC392|nr:hypothetical protein [Nocardiopsis lucentensis]
MAVDPSDVHDRLPCTNSVDALLRHLVSGALTEHESACPYCREQAEELRPLVTAVRQSDEQRVTAPTGLVSDVMRVVRAERRPGRTIVLDGPGPGGTEIRESAVAALLRASVDTVPGVVVGRCRIEQTARGVIIRAAVRVALDRPIPEATAAARSSMRALVEERLGLPVVRVDLDVVDVRDNGDGNR